MKRLVEFADSGVVAGLYRRLFSRFPCPERPLLFVPSHCARELDEDLVRVGIPKVTEEGKLDFHGLRTAFVTLAAEAGANMKELQTLARHSTPELTANVYARTRQGRLSELAEKIGETVLFDSKCATGVHCKPIEATVCEPKLLPNLNLGENAQNGGGGIRTPVPRCFRASIYMRSRSI